MSEASGVAPAPSVGPFVDPDAMPPRDVAARDAAARELAAREFAAWRDDPRRSSIARRTQGARATPERVLSLRLEGVLAHDRPASANRRWLCESIRAWAPLEVIFPTRDYRGLAGVSGELPRHYALLVERAYGHVLAATRSVTAACDLLRADAQLLELQIAVATALQPLLQAATPPAAMLAAATVAAANPAAANPAAAKPAAASPTATALEWPRELRDMSLAMAEFLHRHSIGLSPVLADPVVMTYTAQISKLRRNLEDECRRARAA
jgi:hypothetical protein